MKQSPVLVLMLGLLIFSSQLVSADVLIIANKDVPDAVLSGDAVRDIFLGKKVKWKNDAEIHFVVSENGALHEAFLKRYVKRSASQFKAYWRNMVFTGNGSEPESVDPDSKRMEYVANTPGAVSYIDSGTAPLNVNTITVE